MKRTFDISSTSSAKEARIIDGVCYDNHYQDEIRDEDSESETFGEMIPNPETKIEFFDRMVIQYIKNCVKSYESSVATREAREAAITNADKLNITSD